MKYWVIFFLLYCYTLNSFEGTKYFDIIKSGTFNKNIKTKIEKEKLNRVNSDYNRPELQAHYPSPKAYFLIHYDTSGVNAVDYSDINNNDIPDYIDSVAFYFDYIYEIEVNEMGFLSPLPDSAVGGSDAYDIYVIESGSGLLYETFYGMTVNDLQIFPKRTFDRFTAFTLIDNNYSPFDSTELEKGVKIKTFNETAMTALKITAAHEFHHAIQYMYGIPDPDMSFINEMSSTAIEHIIFPESNDYLQFVNDFIRNYQNFAFSDPSAIVGYRYGIFGIFLYKKYGIDYLRKTWENIYQGLLPYEALINTLNGMNKDFDDEFCDFINEFFYAANFKESNVFDNAKKFANPEFDIVSEVFSDFELKDSLNPYELHGFRFHFINENKVSDSLDLIISSKNQTALKTLEYNSSQYSINIKDYFVEGYHQLNSGKYFYKISDEESYCVDYYYRSNIKPEIIDYAFPSPYKRTNNHEEIHFPVDSHYEIYEVIKLNIFSFDMALIHSKIGQVKIVNNKKVVSLNNLPLEISAGVYIFTTGDADFQKLGKLIVIE